MKRVIVRASSGTKAPKSFKDKISWFIDSADIDNMFPIDFICKQLDFYWDQLYKDVMALLEDEIDYIGDYCDSEGIDVREATRTDSICADIYDDLRVFLKALLYVGPLDGEFRPEPHPDTAINPHSKFIPSANI